MAAAVGPGPRRQERGLRRMESILDATEQVIAEVGCEAATTNLIAAQAGISPGSLYQYFPNKAALLEALGRRYLAQLTEAHGEVFDPALAGLPLAELIDRVVDPLVAFNVAHPAAKALMAGGDLSPDVAAATAELHAALCDRVEALVAARGPQRDPADTKLAAEVTVQIFAGVLTSVLAAGPRDRPRAVRELKAALTGYWAALERH